MATPTSATATSTDHFIRAEVMTRIDLDCCSMFGRRMISCGESGSMKNFIDNLSYVSYSALLSFAFVALMVILNRRKLRHDPSQTRHPNTVPSTIAFWVFFTGALAVWAFAHAFLKPGDESTVILAAALVIFPLVFWGVAFYGADAEHDGLVAEIAAPIELCAAIAGLMLAVRDVVSTDAFRVEIQGFAAYYGLAGGVAIIGGVIAVTVAPVFARAIRAKRQSPPAP